MVRLGTSINSDPEDLSLTDGRCPNHDPVWKPVRATRLKGE